MEDRSWEVSSSPIVKVLWKSEPEVMAEEVLVRGAWMLTALSLVTCLLALIQGVVFCLFVFSPVTSYKESLPLGAWYIIILLLQHITNKTR